MGPLPKNIRLTGGAARSPSLRKILGAALNASVQTSEREEAGAAGTRSVGEGLHLAAFANERFDRVGGRTGFRHRRRRRLRHPRHGPEVGRQPAHAALAGLCGGAAGNAPRASREGPAPQQLRHPRVGHAVRHLREFDTPCGLRIQPRARASGVADAVVQGCGRLICSAMPVVTRDGGADKPAT
eukprot:gene46566-63083_t